DTVAAGNAVTVAEWDALYTLLTRSLLVASILSLYEDMRKGKTITGRLAQLGLSLAAFSYLLRVRTLLAGNQPVLESEWGAVYSILAQVRKLRRFADWRREERSHLLLSPDYFNIPVTPSTLLPQREVISLPEWRVTYSARRDWQEKLQAR